MAYNKLSNYKTTVTMENGQQRVTYHSTAIVCWNAETITLRSGGHESVTTKRKMNQAANQFGLNYGVSQKDFVWSVTLPSGKTVPFEDGMTFPR